MIAQDTLELVKQGDVQAIAKRSAGIATLMNKALLPKGITVQIKMADKSITVIGESEETIEQSFFVDYVHETISKLNLPAQRLYIRGQITGNKNPIWRQTINLQQTEVINPVANTENNSPFQSKFNGFKIINTTLLGAILGILVLNIWWKPQTETVTWEYKIESFEDIVFDSGMNRMGGQGWELVSARRAITGGEYSNRGIYECIFKRPKQETNNES
ncbi:MAG: hypothetical protein PT120_02950 [Aphanizomenon gracile PMC649.10]|nr:hypothetical protein [Aphanizomenon gracile PMC649.10]